MPLWPLDRRMDDPEARVAPFLVTAAGAEGLTANQVRAARFAATSRGVRLPRERVADPGAIRRAAVLGSSPDAVLVDNSAARYWGLPLPPRLGLGAEVGFGVARPPGGARPVRPDVRGRRLLLPAHHVIEVEGLRVTSPARTWLDCAADIGFANVVAMGDHVLRHELSVKSELEEIVRWARRRRGVVAARQALPLLDPRAESPGESITRVHLITFGLPRPEVNINVFHNGRWIARVDIAWREARLVLEYDGAVHLQEDVRRRDAVRRNELQEAGWLVLTVTADDLRRPTDMATRVAANYWRRLRQFR